MKRLISRILILILIFVLGTAYASGISTSVILRTSKVTQNAVINVGEDLSMEVLVEGAEPAAYQWYFNNNAIDRANQKYMAIIDAEVSDSGVYRMDAFDEDGRMIVSMDINARVIDPNVPKSGDNSMPIEIALGAFALAGIALMLIYRRKAI